jgi:hypothetical protein
MSKNFYSNCSKVLVFVFIVCVTSAYSQGIPDALRLGQSGLGPNARALGMGNAYVGLSDDASAAYYNPAGFGLIKRLELSGGLDYSNYTNNATFFGKSTNYSNSTTRLNRLSFAFPFPTVRGSLVFGISYLNTKDFTGALKFDGFNNTNDSYIRYLSLRNNDAMYNLYLSYPLYDNANNYIKDTTNIFGNLNQSGNNLYSGSTNNWTFSGAIEAAENLFLGLNLNIISGSYNSNSDYYEDDVNNLYQGEASPGETQTRDFITLYSNRILNWDISGWSAKAGLIYQFNDIGRFGLTVQFPKYYTVKETFNESDRSDFAPSSQSYSYSDEVKYDIVSPFEFAAGFSINFKGLIFSAQGTAIDYSQLKFDNPENFSNPEDLLSVNKDIKGLLGGVINYNVGVEYTIPTVGLRLRTGYFVQPSAYKDDPSEFNRKYFTAGIGILTQETIGLDFGYAHGWWSDYGDNYGSGESRTYQDIKYDKLMLTATYRF